MHGSVSATAFLIASYRNRLSLITWIPSKLQAATQVDRIDVVNTTRRLFRPNMSKSFPAVQPGGSLILAWQIKDKKVLVVGGGEVRTRS